MLAPKDLVVEAQRAIVVAKIEADVLVLVLDDKFDSKVAGSRAHGFQLQRSVVAREHAAVIVACIVDERPSFLQSTKCELARSSNAVGVTLRCLTSLLGQLAPFPKHLASALWMPKESMPAMAARIEVVFILGELFVLVGGRTGCLDRRMSWR